MGDRVEVRSLGEIQNTLDANGCLDGLPFIPEMVKFCGQRASVFRCVDKIYDMVEARRCDGSRTWCCSAVFGATAALTAGARRRAI
jgi:hypothetical protein